MTQHKSLKARDARLKEHGYDLIDFLLITGEPLYEAGGCFLSDDGESYTMVGPTGEHSLLKSVTDQHRLRAHWNGFVAAAKVACYERAASLARKRGLNPRGEHGDRD